MAGTDLTEAGAAGMPRRPRERQRNPLVDYPPSSELAFPGCKPVHLPHEELETCDGRLDRTLDVVHERFGEGVLTRARRLDAELRSGR